MSEAIVTFGKFEKALVVQAYQPGLVPLWELPPIQLTADAQSSFALKMHEALKLGQEKYPLHEGKGLRNVMVGHLLDQLVAFKQNRFRFVLSKETTWVLPHMLPVAIRDRGGRPDPTTLDMIAPAYWTLKDIQKGYLAEWQGSNSIAIVADDGNERFEKIAKRLHNSIWRNKSYAKHCIFWGSEIAGDAIGKLNVILRTYRVVVFIGHLTPDNDDRHGWLLCSKAGKNAIVTMANLKLILGKPDAPISELVFAGCCGGAQNERDSCSDNVLPYAEVFLGAGVKYFAGAWAKLYFLHDAGMTAFAEFVSRFCTAWIRDPGGAAEHMYNAKYPPLNNVRDYSSLMHSMFQLYVLREERLHPADRTECAADIEKEPSVGEATSSGSGPMDEPVAASAVPVAESANAGNPAALEAGLECPAEKPVRAARLESAPAPEEEPGALTEFPMPATLTARAGTKAPGVAAWELDFVEMLLREMLAKRRLFGVDMDDPEELLRALVTGCERTVQGLDGPVDFRIFVAESEKGLFDAVSGVTPVPWITAEQVDAAKAYYDPGGGATTAEELGAYNGAAIFGHLRNLEYQLPARTVPVILFKGAGWWNFGPACDRALRECHHFQRSAIIIADRDVNVDPDLAELFTFCRYPFPPSNELVPLIQNFCKAESIPLEDSVATAIGLALAMYPCSPRWLKYHLRLGALKFGALNEKRVVEMREADRRRSLLNWSTIHYVSLAHLPAAAHFGLPGPSPEKGGVTRNDVDAWVGQIQANARSDYTVFKRVLIEGPAGCGKTAMSQMLAVRLDSPWVVISSAACLGRMSGESIARMSATLNAVAGLGRAVILFDDADAFFAHEEIAAQPLSSALLRWLDTSHRFAPEIVFVATVRDRLRLPIEWQSRFVQRFYLPEPKGAAQAGRRTAIFAARFRAHDLDALADDGGLMRRLAETTDPVAHLGRTIQSPSAWVTQCEGLKRHRTVISTAADISYWVAETIRLRGEGNPRERAFWENRLAVNAG